MPAILAIFGILKLVAFEFVPGVRRALNGCRPNSKDVTVRSPYRFPAWNRLMHSGTLLALVVGSAVHASAAEPARPGLVDKALIAHWTFDEETGNACADSRGRGHDASPEGPAVLGRVEGLFGNAVKFPELHKLRVPGMPDVGCVERITLSAWTLPVEFEDDNEIFHKEDGNDRVLFAFQANGTILSLGLNIGGYVQCGASIKPARLLDGNWHHCAATFDGQMMRVYLDGREIGSLNRTGLITAGASRRDALARTAAASAFKAPRTICGSTEKR